MKTIEKRAAAEVTVGVENGCRIVYLAGQEVANCGAADHPVVAAHAERVAALEVTRLATAARIALDQVRAIVREEIERYLETDGGPPAPALTSPIPRLVRPKPAAGSRDMPIDWRPDELDWTLPAETTAGRPQPALQECENCGGTMHRGDRAAWVCPGCGATVARPRPAPESPSEPALAAAPGKHPDVAALLAGTLSESEQEDAERHWLGCPTCQSQWEELFAKRFPGRAPDSEPPDPGLPQIIAASRPLVDSLGMGLRWLLWRVRHGVPLGEPVASDLAERVKAWEATSLHDQLQREVLGGPLLTEQELHDLPALPVTPEESARATEAVLEAHRRGALTTWQADPAEYPAQPCDCDETAAKDCRADRPGCAALATYSPDPLTVERERAKGIKDTANALRAERDALLARIEASDASISAALDAIGAPEGLTAVMRIRAMGAWMQEVREATGVAVDALDELAASLDPESTDTKAATARIADALRPFLAAVPAPQPAPEGEGQSGRESGTAGGGKS